LKARLKGILNGLNLISVEFSARLAKCWDGEILSSYEPKNLC